MLIIFIMLTISDYPYNEDNWTYLNMMKIPRHI